jgi:hypothetical protein
MLSATLVDRSWVSANFVAICLSVIVACGAVFAEAAFFAGAAASFVAEAAFLPTRAAFAAATAFAGTSLFLAAVVITAGGPFLAAAIGFLVGGTAYFLRILRVGNLVLIYAFIRIMRHRVLVAKLLEQRRER